MKIVKLTMYATEAGTGRRLKETVYVNYSAIKGRSLTIEAVNLLNPYVISTFVECADSHQNDCNILRRHIEANFGSKAIATPYWDNALFQNFIREDYINGN